MPSCSNYESKCVYFDSKAGGSATRPTAKEQADQFLSGALEGRQTVTAAEISALKRARENGGLSKQTTDKEISNYATKVGYHHQATVISQNMPTTDGLCNGPTTPKRCNIHRAIW
jgi:hypothetical protein